MPTCGGCETELSRLAIYAGPTFDGPTRETVTAVFHGRGYACGACGHRGTLDARTRWKERL